MLAQLAAHGLLLCLRRRHAINESSHVIGKITVAVLSKQIGNGVPSVLDLAPSFHQRAFTGFGAGVAL